MRMMMKNLKKSLRKNQRSIIKRKTKKPKPKSRRNQVRLKKRKVNRKHKKAHFRIKVWQKLLKACKPSWKLTTRNGLQKFQKTVSDYEQQMSQTEERFKKDFKKRNKQYEDDTMQLNEKH